jgi:hypothetical protein
MDIYHEMADGLLKLKNYNFWNSPLHGLFGFEYKENYSGLMAKPSKGKVRRKQGLFDFVILTGTRFDKLTHRDLFLDLLTYTNIDSCLEVWRGKDPRILGKTIDEKEALTEMALAMFEQEVNWGNNDWQKWTNFSPKETRPSELRPRDMIMGYVRQAYHFGPDKLDKMKFWIIKKPGSIFFMDRDESPYGYQTYPDDLKKFFTGLAKLKGTEALMVGETKKRFKILAETLPSNPNFDN